MYINFTVSDDEKNIGEGPIQVGWFLTKDKASILFEPPYRMRSQSQTKHAKSASHCPAVLQLESRYFVLIVLSTFICVLLGMHKANPLLSMY